MAAEATSPFPHIVRDPRVQGGEPTVAGTRVPVRALVVAHRGQPNIEYLCGAYPSLNAALIREALEFYQVHRNEIDGLIAGNEADVD
jgi:uncharacterized protein (DUF433 family)